MQYTRFPKIILITNFFYVRGKKGSTVALITLTLSNRIEKFKKKCSPGPGFEPGSPALRAGALLIAPPRRIAGSSHLDGSSAGPEGRGIY